MRIRSFWLAVALLVAPLFLPTPTAGLGRPGITPVPCGSIAWQPTDATFDALPGAKAYFGVYDGGLYHIEVPQKWNGELVLSAHGYVAASSSGRGQQLRVGEPLFRKHLIENGYAWAASSYKCNGYVPGQGLVDTMALTDLVTKVAGRAATRVYLTGTSMGGHVTVLGMHEFPTAFAGGMAMCASGPELFDYDTAVSAAAEVLAGVQFTRDNMRELGPTFTDVFGTPDHYTEKGRAMANVQIDLSGGPRPFAVEGLAGMNRFGSNNVSGVAGMSGSTSPASAVTTNMNYKYALDAAMGLAGTRLSDMVRKKQPDMTYRDGNGPYEELVPFDGKIERPLLTLHGTGDLFVPIHLERTLNRAVAAAGTQDLLVQRIYRIGGHCGFNAEEEAKSFDDLVAWVHDGKKPQGDDIMGDLKDAGRKFTSPLRPGDPGGLRVK